jgi:hypothetical protein
MFFVSKVGFAGGQAYARLDNATLEHRLAAIRLVHPGAGHISPNKYAGGGSQPVGEKHPLLDGHTLAPNQLRRQYRQGRKH